MGSTTAGFCRAAALLGLFAAVSAPLVSVSAIAAAPIVATGGSCASGGNLGWTNATQTIKVGDAVTWSNCSGGNHTLQSASPGWCLASGTSSGSEFTNWHYSCSFTAAGTYAYECGVHGS